jgi:hypothetical protein
VHRDHAHDLAAGQVAQRQRLGRPLVHAGDVGAERDDLDRRRVDQEALPDRVAVS